MLPLGPPDRYGSPYKSASAFAAVASVVGVARARGCRKSEVLDFVDRQGLVVGVRVGTASAPPDALLDQCALRARVDVAGTRIAGEARVFG